MTGIRKSFSPCRTKVGADHVETSKMLISFEFCSPVGFNMERNHWLDVS